MKNMIPYATMRNYSDVIKEYLKSCCTIVEIAGSMRRFCDHKEHNLVGDIEFVIQPTMDEDCTLFEMEKKESVAVVFMNRMAQKRIELSNDLTLHHEVGKPDGRYMKFVLLQNEAILTSVEICIPQVHDFYRILAIRTGPSDYSHQVIAKRWVEKGWRGTDKGLRKESDCYAVPSGEKTLWKCTSSHAQLPPVWNSEKEFFEWLELEYQLPHLRCV